VELKRTIYRYPGEMHQKKRNVQNQQKKNKPSRAGPERVSANAGAGKGRRVIPAGSSQREAMQKKPMGQASPKKAQPTKTIRRKRSPKIRKNTNQQERKLKKPDVKQSHPYAITAIKRNTSRYGLDRTREKNQEGKARVKNSKTLITGRTWNDEKKPGFTYPQESQGSLLSHAQSILKQPSIWLTKP